MKYQKGKENYTIIEVNDNSHNLEEIIKVVNYQLAKVILKYLEKINE